MSHDQSSDLAQRLDVARERSRQAVDLHAELDAQRRRLTIARLDRASRLMEERCVNEHCRAVAKMSAAKSE
jgi:AmiR/NasT family two-component response regulator